MAASKHPKLLPAARKKDKSLWKSQVVMEIGLKEFLRNSKTAVKETTAVAKTIDAEINQYREIFSSYEEVVEQIISLESGMKNSKDDKSLKKKLKLAEKDADNCRKALNAIEKNLDQSANKIYDVSFVDNANIANFWQ